MLCFHYWRRREPPGSLSAGDFRSGFIAKAMFLVFILVVPKKFHGKTNGLVHLANYIRKSHMFFSTIGGDGSRQCPSVAPIFVRVLQQKPFVWSSFWQCQQILTEKQMVWCTWPIHIRKSSYIVKYKCQTDMSTIDVKCTCFFSFMVGISFEVNIFFFCFF